MKTNMGGFDRILRVILAAVVAVLFFAKQITGSAAVVLGIIAIAFILTGLFGFCPVYAPFKIVTKKKAKYEGPTRLDAV